MAYEVYPQIYLQEIPLPGNPLKAINSYIVKTKNRSLVIDTGFNRTECREALMGGIEELQIDLRQADILVTHLHADHSGLAAALGNEGASVFAGQIDGMLINEMSQKSYWQRFDTYCKWFGLKEDHITFEEHPGYKYCPKEPVDFQLLLEGDRLEIGDFKFEVIDVPGHTPGHIGLYEPQLKLLFCGDHILDRITPNIAFWGYGQDILTTYFESLQKVYDLDVDYLFTAHRNIIRDHKRRIDELRAHHAQRLDEIVGLIENGEKTVREVAGAMHWELSIKDFDAFPANQKWFASGEAMAHLEHLVYTGRATKRSVDEVLMYKSAARL